MRRRLCDSVKVVLYNSCASTSVPEVSLACAFLIFAYTLLGVLAFTAVVWSSSSSSSSASSYSFIDLL